MHFSPKFSTNKSTVVYPTDKHGKVANSVETDFFAILKKAVSEN